ncbi:MAG: hypothetical protein ACE5J1_06415 [Nitrospiria bacterium]
MQLIPLSKKRLIPSLLATGLVVYLLLFSSFALFHAYSENEIIDSHECAIGFWVQHGQATFTFLVTLAVFLSIIASNLIHQCSFICQSQASQIVPRGPPFFS